MITDKPAPVSGETPRTDAFWQWEHDNRVSSTTALYQFARTLERELIEARAENERLKKDILQLQISLDKINDDCLRAEAALVQAEAAIRDAANQIPPYIFKTTTQDLSIEEWRKKHGEAVVRALAHGKG